MLSQINNKKFKKDKYKDGGSYIKYVGDLKKIDIMKSKLIFCDNKEIFLSDIYDININFIKDQ